MNALLGVALCILAPDVSAAVVRARGVPPQPDEVRISVEAAADAWRTNELPSDELTVRLVSLGASAEPYVLQLFVAARRASPGELPAPLPVAPLASALGSIGGEGSLWPLVDVLRSTSQEERAAAAHALGGLGSVRGLVPLLDTLDDESILVRAAARAATLALTEEHPELAVVDALARRWVSFVRRDQLGLALGEIGSDDARAVLRSKLGWLDDEDATLAALGGLWLCGVDDDGEAVLDVLLSTRSLAVRRKSCLLLGKLGYGPAVRVLIDLLEEEHRGLVNDAHWALMRITGQPLRAASALWESWWERTVEGH